MRRWSFRQRRPPIGARPGTIDVGLPGGEIAINVIRYSGAEFEMHPGVTPARARELAEPGWTTWVDVIGLGDPETLGAIAELFGLHPLVLDDVVAVPQRPKHNVHGENLLVIARMPELSAELALDLEQLSIVICGDALITFQERPGDVLEPVRRRIAEGNGAIRDLGADYLCYALLDTVVDHYYPIIETLGERLEELEETIIEGADESVLDDLSRIRAVMSRLRRSLGPLRDTLARLVRSAEPIDEAVLAYFQAVTDHLGQIVDILDSYRELASGLLNTHLSVVAHRTNDVMRVLTVMASVFIPLTFIAGLYGMNFKHMPELDYRWAYPASLGVMLAVAGLLLWSFRRRGWLGGKRR